MVGLFATYRQAAAAGEQLEWAPKRCGAQDLDSRTGNQPQFHQSAAKGSLASDVLDGQGSADVCVTEVHERSVS
jgi:hypothetical protein